MIALRFFLILLIILNLFAFAAIQNWFGAPKKSGEPERLSNQLHPERIYLIEHDSESLINNDDGIANLSTEPPSSLPVLRCVEWTQLSTGDAQRLYTESIAIGLTPKRTSKEIPAAWWVRIPSLGGKELAERKVKELRTFGITEFFIVQEAGPNQYAISLGVFKNEASANQHLTQLREQGIRSASIAPRNTTQFTIKLEATPEQINMLEKHIRQSEYQQCSS